MDGAVNDLTLADVNVTGTEAAGALAGENQGLLSGIRSSGQVSWGASCRGTGRAQSEARLPLPQLGGGTGMTPPLSSRSVDIVVTFGPSAATGGLVGYNTGFVVLSYATGPVTSDRSAGGLVGYHQSKLIAASYATGPVTGSPAGGLVGTIGTPFQEATIRPATRPAALMVRLPAVWSVTSTTRALSLPAMRRGASRAPQQWRVGGSR